MSERCVPLGGAVIGAVIVANAGDQYVGANAISSVRRGKRQSQYLMLCIMDVSGLSHHGHKILSIFRESVPLFGGFSAV